jgi:hypothetical protein
MKSSAARHFAGIAPACLERLTRIGVRLAAGTAPVSTKLGKCLPAVEAFGGDLEKALPLDVERLYCLQ